MTTVRPIPSGSEGTIPYLAVKGAAEAFASLERAYAEHDYQLQYLGYPEYDSLRSDPRFTALMRRVAPRRPLQ